MKTMIEKLEYIHFAIQEGLNNNKIELEQALYAVEDLIELCENPVFNTIEEIVTIMNQKEIEVN